MHIIPAILTDSELELHKQLLALKPYFNNFQIDIVDGIYLPQKTLGVESATQLIGRETGFGKESGTHFDFDLMVKDYTSALRILESSAQHIHIAHAFVHYRSLGNNPLPSSKSFTIGIAIAPEDQIDELGHKHNLNAIEAIQIMSVHPGSQGSPFLPDVLHKIEQLRAMGYGSSIFLDGGANNKSLPVILQRQYRPDFVCVGSYLSHAEDVSARAAELHALEED